jgi:hypothetical protein
MADHKRRFVKPPKNAKDLHRPLSANEDLTEILTTRHERTVISNLTLHYNRMSLIRLSATLVLIQEQQAAFPADKRRLDLERRQHANNLEISAAPAT